MLSLTEVEFALQFADLRTPLEPPNRFHYTGNFGFGMVSSPLLLFADILIFCLQLFEVHLSGRFFSNNISERLVPTEIESARRQLLMDAEAVAPFLVPM